MVKNPLAKAGIAGDTGSIPGWGKPLEEEMAINSNILDRAPWRATVYGVTKSWM